MVGIMGLRGWNEESSLPYLAQRRFSWGILLGPKDRTSVISTVEITLG
jgi:hypothetical protein